MIGVESWRLEKACVEEKEKITVVYMRERARAHSLRAHPCTSEDARGSHRGTNNGVRHILCFCGGARFVIEFARESSHQLCLFLGRRCRSWRQVDLCSLSCAAAQFSVPYADAAATSSHERPRVDCSKVTPMKSCTDQFARGHFEIFFMQRLDAMKRPSPAPACRLITFQ